LTEQVDFIFSSDNQKKILELKKCWWKKSERKIAKLADK
jgi:hypothetical protein